MTETGVTSLLVVLLLVLQLLSGHLSEVCFLHLKKLLHGK
jgi:hypothetical protein